MTLTLPLDTQDAAYPAALDRMRLKASGVQAGVVESEDFKVSAASGLQVSVAAGRAYVAQTNAVEGSFYDGLYLVGNDGAMTPSGTPTVSATLPQLSQVVLRVYDITELKIAGASYARIEWLNGAPSEGASLANRSGAAELPQSSLRLADVLIPAGAESAEHFEIRDRRPWATGANFEFIEEASLEGGAAEWIYPSLLKRRVETTGNAYEVIIGAEYVFWHTGLPSWELYFGVGVDGSGPQQEAVVGGGGGRNETTWESHAYGPLYRTWWMPSAGQSLMVEAAMRVVLAEAGNAERKAAFYKPSMSVREIVGSYQYNVT